MRRIGTQQLIADAGQALKQFGGRSAALKATPVKD